MDVIQTNALYVPQAQVIDRYSAAYKVCSDVLQIHKKPVQNLTLHSITFEWYQKIKLRHESMNIIRRRKLCCNCREKIQEMINETEAISSSASEMENVLV